MNPATVNHPVVYANGPVHPNSIEGLGAWLQRAWDGQQQHDSTPYMNLYVAEAGVTDKQRQMSCSFDHLVGRMVPW